MVSDAAPRGRIQIGPVRVLAQDNGVDVEIATGSPAAPLISRMKGPDRIILDFPGALPSRGYEHLHVQSSILDGVRISVFREDPPITRVVIDLKQANSYQTTAERDRFIVKISSQVVASENSRPQAALPYVEPAAKKSLPPQPVAAAPAPPKPSAARTPEPVAKAAQSLTAGSAANELSAIAVNHEPGGLSVQFTLTHPVQPQTSSLEHPDRFVIDFPGVIDVSTQPRITVEQNGLKSIRNSLFQSTPPVTRVVLDLSPGTQKPTISMNGTQVLVRLTGVPATDPAKPSEKALARTEEIPRAPIRRSALVADKEVIPRPTRTATRVTVIPPAAANPAPAMETATAAAVPPPSVDSPATPVPLTQMKPQKPEVFYHNGLLTIQAQNCVLADILYEVGVKTGAAIEMPMAQGMLDRVVVNIGPGNPRDVIGSLMQGSSYDYVIVEKNGGLEKIVLTPKPDADSQATVTESPNQEQQ